MHKDWCGKECGECTKQCALDESMPCSPNCENIDTETGEPNGSEDCKQCDAYNKEDNNF